ncbi:hypothetical protein P353_27940 [Comamonas testosteroni]|uniref:DUF3300 domain-containing protein n=2 Tax=Comamonas testosteroni TaxID=285 RepID=A0A096GDM4_COMTE|nr:hypothetical protein P353_27940 [Comamonas testosteroni]
MIALAAAMALSACNDKDSPIKTDSTPPALAPAATPDAAQPQPAAYVPPDADALYRMVAPIALYPDKLVAQILAGATYPDQISAAETWLGQNPGLQRTALSNAVNAQNWDPSVKSLTQFPNVLEQMASNLPWTTALGKAYYNAPSDVMNAIQVMRNRAYKAGTLKTSGQLKVNLASTPAAVAYTPGAVVTPLPEPVIEPPEQFIEISPSQVDTVYVPQYNPAAVYGQPLPVYGGYRYVEVPPPAPVAGVPVMAGLLGFGAAIVLAESRDRHPSWGWNAWNMRWGDPERPWRHGERPPPPQARPAVVYNNTTYISQSRTVVQNIHRTDNTYINNIHENAAGERRGPSGQPQAAGVFAAPGTMAAGAAASAAVGAAAVAASGHALNQRQPAPSPLATQPQGLPDFAQGSNRAPGLPRAPNGHALLQPQDPHDRSSSPGAHPPQTPQTPQMQAAMTEKTLQPRAQEPIQRQQAMQQQMQQRHTQLQQMQQQHAQELAQRQQPIPKAREQQERQQQTQMQQQQQQQRAQEQAQRQQQMQQQVREQQEHRQQAQMQQMQQQLAQEQAQRQQQMQQERQQQEHRQQAQMQQMQQQRAQEQAQRQQQMQQQVREQQEHRQQAQMQQMQQQRTQEQAQRQQQMQQQVREQQEHRQQAQMQQMQQQLAQEQAQRQQQMQQERQQQEHRQQAQMQQMQQQRAQEQAQRQQQMQQERQQQEHRQQAQMQQMQQQRAQEQAQRQQQMQQQVREQQEHRQQAQMQQMQQQRTQEQAQRQQQMQQQVREQQEHRQQAQMQQMQQQRAQEQAQRQQQAQMQAQHHQAEQQARMQAARAEGRTRGDREHR